MAKDKDKDAAATMAAEVPPAAQATPGEPSLADVLSQLQAIAADNAAMKAELAALKNPPTAQATPGPVREFTPDKPLKAPKSFNVSLPHGVAAKVTIETDGVREIDFKDRAIAEYNRLMSITSTVHPYSVGEA